jgi:putative intracellular protease/amidase
MKILMVLTSHDRLCDTARRSSRRRAPISHWLLPKADSRRSTRGRDSERANAGNHSFPDKAARAALANTKVLSTIKGGDYDAVFYPGGHGPFWDIANDANSIALIETMFAAGQPLALVCHGPAALRYTRKSDGSPVVAGKSVTGFSNSEEAAVGLIDVVPFLVEDMLRNNGGNYSKKANWHSHAVTDGGLVTGQNPVSSEATAKALLERLHAHGKSGETARSTGGARTA